MEEFHKAILQVIFMGVTGGGVIFAASAGLINTVLAGILMLLIGIGNLAITEYSKEEPTPVKQESPVDEESSK